MRPTQDGSRSDILRRPSAQKETSEIERDGRTGAREKEGSLVRLHRERDNDETRNRDEDKKSQVEANLTKEINSEKQGYLLELMKFKKQDVEMTRKYTMEDSLEDIQFEFDRIRTHLETVNNVNMIRDGLMFAFQGIEFANKQFGPVLQLNGWSQAAKKDKQKYNHVIERLYKKHWRHGNMSPETEFGWLIGSSMLKHHFKCKLLGGSQSKGGDDGSDDDDSSSLAKKGGPSKPKGGFDLSSLMSTMLPKFAGFGGGNANAGPKPNIINAPVGAALPKPTSARPVMRGPNAGPDASAAEAPLPMATPSHVPVAAATANANANHSSHASAMPYPIPIHAQTHSQVSAPEYMQLSQGYKHHPPLGHGNFFNAGHVQQQQQAPRHVNNPGHGHSQQQANHTHFNSAGHQHQPGYSHSTSVVNTQQEFSMQLDGMQRMMNEKLRLMKEENDRLMAQLVNGGGAAGALNHELRHRSKLKLPGVGDRSFEQASITVTEVPTSVIQPEKEQTVKNAQMQHQSGYHYDDDDESGDDATPADDTQAFAPAARNKGNRRETKESEDESESDDESGSDDDEEEEVLRRPVRDQKVDVKQPQHGGGSLSQTRGDTQQQPGVATNSFHDDGKQISIVGQLNSRPKSKRSTPAKKNVVSLLQL